MNALLLSLTLSAATPTAPTADPGFKMPKEQVAKARALEKQSADAMAQGQFDAATQPLLDAIEIWKKYRGPNAIEVYNDEVNAAVAYRRAGKLALAVPLLESAISGLKTSTEPGAPALRHEAMNSLAIAYASAQRQPDAKPVFEALLAELKSEPPSDLRARAGSAYAQVLQQLKDYANADAAAKANLADWRALRGKDEDPEVVKAMVLVGLLALQQNKLADARPPLEKAAAIAAQIKVPAEDQAYDLLALAQLELRTSRFDVAKADFDRVVSLVPAGHPLAAQANQGLQVVAQKKKPQPAPPRRNPGDYD